MHVIHFTEGATDTLWGLGARSTRFVPLADGDGDTHVSCLHLLAGADAFAPPVTHDCALLIVHGTVIFTLTETGLVLDVLPGMGLVLRNGERYSLRTSSSAILLAIECKRLEATELGISTPARIAGQRWPGESDVAPIEPPSPG